MSVPELDWLTLVPIDNGSSFYVNQQETPSDLDNKGSLQSLYVFIGNQI